MCCALHIAALLAESFLYSASFLSRSCDDHAYSIATQEATENSHQAVALYRHGINVLKD